MLATQTHWSANRASPGSTGFATDLNNQKKSGRVFSGFGLVQLTERRHQSSWYPVCLPDLPSGDVVLDDWWCRNWVISFREEVSGQQVENYRLSYFSFYSSWKVLLLWCKTSQLTSELRRNPWKGPGSVERFLLSNLSQILIRTAIHNHLFLIIFHKPSSFSRPVKTGAETHLPQVHWNGVCAC